MIRITAEPHARAPTRQPRTNGNGRAAQSADGATIALAVPGHLSSLAGHPSSLAGHSGGGEPPLRALSRLAAARAERLGSVSAGTTLGGLLADLPGTATADISACLEALCRDLARCFARPGAPLLSCSTAAHQLPSGTVMTLGLIADLLLTNAYTFGFVPPAGGRIAIAFAALEGSFELTIEDSGLGGPHTGQCRANAVTIASLLVAELGGWLETPKVVGGSRCIVVVPRHDNRRSH